MSFEKFNSREEFAESLEHKKIRVRNEIQMTIMAHLCSPDEGEDCFINWINENSQKFGEVFDRVLSKDESMLDKWDKNPALYTELFMDELGDSAMSKAA